MMRSRNWIILAGCVVILLSLGLWTKGAKRHVKKPPLNEVAVSPEVETAQELQQAMAKEGLPKPLEKSWEVLEITISDQPDEVEEEIEEPSEILVTIQGAVTSMDPCTQEITVDSTTVDVSSCGNFPMYRTYQTGDFVEVTYREKRAGNVLEFIEILQER